MSTAGNPAAQSKSGAQSSPAADKPAEDAAKPSNGMEAWLNAHIQVLRRAYDNLEASDFRGAALKDFVEVATEMRGQAADMGFPLASNVADCLCHLLDGTPDVERLPRTLVRQHVDAIRAIVAEGAADAAHSIGVALVARLRDVTDDFIATEAKRANAA